MFVSMRQRQAIQWALYTGYKMKIFRLRVVPGRVCVRDHRVSDAYDRVYLSDVDPSEFPHEANPGRQKSYFPGRIGRNRITLRVQCFRLKLGIPLRWG